MPIRWAVPLILCLSIASAQEHTLSNLCQKAIKGNPKIKSFSYKSSASGSRYDQSVDQYKPHLNISGQYSRQNYKLGNETQVYPFLGNSYGYNISLSQPLYRAQLLHAMTDAKAREKLAKLQEKDEKAKLITQILQVSIALIREREIVNILEKKVSLLEKAYENIKQKHKLKLVSGADSFQSLAMMQQAKSDLVKARQTYKYKLYNLRLLAKQKEVEAYITPLHFNIPAVEKDFRNAKLNAIRKHVGNNTRLRLDEQSVQIAKVQIGLRNSERSPQIDATLSYGDAGGTIDSTVRQDNSRAMLTLNFPIYQGGYVDDRVEESKYLYFAAREEAQNTRLNIKISLEKALQDIKSGLESVKAEEAAAAASKKYFEGMLKSYQGGVASLTDAYLAEAEYRDSLLRLVNRKADTYLSLVAVYYYIGKANIRNIRDLQRKYLSR